MKGDPGRRPACPTRIAGRAGTVLLACLALCLGALAAPVQDDDTPRSPARGRAALPSPAPAGFGEVRAVGGRDRIFALAAWQGGAVAVGARGLMMTRAAHAEGWERLAAPTGQGGRTAENLYALAAAGDRLWVAGDGGRLWSSGDLDDWQEARVGADAAVFVLTHTPDGALVAAGEFGLLAEQGADGTWREVTLDWRSLLADAWAQFGEAVPHFYGACRGAQATFVAGEFGLLLRRDAEGWSRVHGGGIEPALYGCATGEDGRELVAVGQRGLILRSTDGGQSWQTVREAKGADLYRVVRVSGGWVAAGDERRFRVSRDGVHWRCQRSDPAPVGWYVDLLPVAGGRLIAAGGPGVLGEVEPAALLAGKGVTCD